jgi:hypothetical protein
MKKNKLLLIITLITFISCSSNDDMDTIPMLQEVKATLDLTALANLTGNDATHLIKFNGVSAEQYTSVAIAGDQIIYKIETNDPTTIVRITKYEYTSGSMEVWKCLRPINTNGWQVGLKVNEDSTENNLECKFDIQFQLEVNGVLQTNKTYIIDPKIRIRATR